MLLVYHCPKCSTCQKALHFLKERDVEVVAKSITEETPTKDELRVFWQKSGLELKRFFNTSGMKYRELGLKDKLAKMSEDEQLTLLASDGMLIKRPLLIADHVVLTGFKQDKWEKIIEELNDK